MADEQSETKQQVLRDPSVRSNNFVSLYVNNTNCGYTRFDIQAVFSRTQLTMTDTPSIEEVAVVTMSPQHAKAFLQAFEGNLKSYEKQYGEIVLDPEKTEAQAEPETSPEKKPEPTKKSK
jgi:hypothetical protein